MASDPVAKAVEDLNRTLKEISSSLKEHNRLLKKLSDRIPKGPTTSDEPVVVPPAEEETVAVPSPDVPAPIVHKVYGFSMAALVQREGGLNIGDQKIELDESRWNWTGETWERVELPSGQA